MSSRWADTPEDYALQAERKRVKAAKKHQKLAEKSRQEQSLQTQPAQSEFCSNGSFSKRRRLSVRPNDSHTAEIRNLQPGEEPKYDMLRFEGGFLGKSNPAPIIYEKLNNVAEGSYGKVFRAACSRTGQTVAIKKLKTERHANKKIIPSFGLREIKILKNSGHRNVVKLVDVVASNSSPYLDTIHIVLEFAAHDLYGLLTSYRPGFLASEIKTLMHQLLNGLHYLHDNWIIHRDLKPSNILLTDKAILKIADFGMARYVSDPHPYPLTQLVTTLWYRAPEIILGARDYGFVVDLWAAGCIFVELLLKKPLFDGAATEAALISQIITFCGPFNDSVYPNYRQLPNAELFKTRLISPQNPGMNLKASLQKKVPGLPPGAVTLLEGLLALDPHVRLTSRQALDSEYFLEKPKAKQEHLFPTFPSRAKLEHVPER